MNRRVFCLLLACVGLAVAPCWAATITISTVPVGNPGNTGPGAVDYNFRIGTTGVTNAQYTEFLNAKAASDPLSLYDAVMGSLGGITRSGTDGSYTYQTVPGRENMPVAYVNWYDAIRFANWLHNGQGSGDTETGAYTLEGGTPTPTNGLIITRNPGATWFLPSENEWYKAAYHKNDGATGNYFAYPTSSNTAPTAELPPGSSNSGNFSSVASNSSGTPWTDVGAYVNSPSPYGTFDQGGNLWEWNEALIDGNRRGLRGGAWSDDPSWSHRSQRQSHLPGLTDARWGFRVATVPEPSTVVLAILGCAIILCRRKWFKQS